MANGDPQKKLSPQEFAAKIKSKYPQYKDMDDSVLVDKILKKYPQYESQVDIKKKIQAEPSTPPSTTSGAMDSTGLVSETPQQPTSSGLPQSPTQNFSGVSVAPTQEQQLGAIQGQQGEPLLGQQIAQEALPTKEEEKRYYTLPSGKKVELAPKDYSEERGTLKSIYTRLDKAAAEQLSSLASVPKSLYELASIPQNKLAEEMNMPWLKSNWETAKQTVDVFGTLEQLDQTAEAYSDYAEEKQKEISSAYDKTITEYIKEGDYDTAARAVVDGVAEAAPFTATVVFTGGGTGSLSRAKSVGTITTLSYHMQKQQIMQEYPDMSEEEASRVAASLAIWEGVMEQYTQKIGRVAFGTYKKKGLDEAQKQLTNTFKETVRKVADKITDSPAGQIIGSGAEEGATQLVQNFTKVVQAEGRMPTTEELLEGVPDATIIGAAMGGGFALSTATQQTQDDSQRQERIVSSEERVGEEPVQAEPEQVTSEEEVSDGGVVLEEQVQTEEVTPEQVTQEDVVEASTEEPQPILTDKQQKVQDFARRVAREGKENFTPEEEQFYAENQEDIDAEITKSKRDVPKEQSKIRSLAQKIESGAQEFTSEEVDLYAANEDAVLEERSNIAEAENRAMRVLPEMVKEDIKKRRESPTVTMSERQALKEQLRNQAKGSRSAMTEQRSFQKQVSESLNDIPFRSKLSGNQVRAIIRKAGKVLADRPESVENFLEYVDRVVSDANFANDVQDAASAKRRLKKKLKDENLPANRKEAIRRLTDIEPSELQDPKEFADLANRVLKTTKKGTRGIVPDAEINEFVDNNSDALTKEKETVESRIEKNLESIARSEEEMLDTLIEEGYGDVDENTSSEELRRVFNEYLNEQHSAKVSEKRAEVKEQLENAPDNKLLNEVRGANLEGIPFDELVFISDVLENFSVNKEIFNLGNAVNIIRANNDGNLITERVERTKKATGIKLGNLNFAQTIIGTMSNIYQKIYRSNKKLMTYVSDKFGDVQRDRAAAKMIRMSSEKQNAYNEEVNKLNRDYGVRLESFANQARISIRAILDQPPLRVRQGQQTYEEFIQNVKDNIVQSIAVLRAEGNDTHADELQKMYDEQLKDIQTNEDFVLSEPEAKVLEFMREMHSEREADIEEFLAMYKNEVLDKDTPYTAIRIVKQSEPVLMETSEDLVSNFTKTNIQAPKSANLIERNRGSYKLAPNARYSFDFSSNQFNAYQRTNMEVLMSPITKKMAYIMNSGRFNDAFGGVDNVNKIKGLLNDQLTSRYAITNLYNAGDLGKILGKKVTIKTVSELERRLRNLSARYVFGVSQLIKQSPVVINTLREHPVAFITHMGKMMSDASYRKAARDIMNESTVGVRDIVTENIAQESLLFRSETKKGRVARNLSTMDKKAGEAVLFPLRITDRIVARASFMAYYKAYIEEQGGVFDIQKEAENINSEAMTYAEIRIRQYQNASITEAASRYQNVSGAFRVMRGILMPFSSFNANRNSTMVTDYQNLAYSTAKVKEAIKNGDTEALSEASRVVSESVKSLAGLTLETLAFNYAGRAAMIYLVDLLFSLMYDEEEYVDGESQLIKDDKESKKRISNTVLDMIPLVGMYDGTKIGASELINMGYYQMDEANKILTYEEYKQAGYTPITYYSPRGVGDASWLDALGQYSIPIESAVNSIELFDNAQDGFMVDKNGNKIYLDEFQRKDAMKSAILGMLASAGYGVAEMNFANSKLKFELEKDGYKSEMERAIMQRVKESYKETYDDLISEMLSDVDEFEDFKRDVNDGYLDPVEQMDGAISGSVKKLMTKDRGRNQLYRTVSSKKNTRVRSAYLSRLLKGKSEEEVKQAYADIFVNSMMLQGGMSAEEALEVIARTSRLLKEGKK